MFGLKGHYKTKHLKLLNKILQPSTSDIWNHLSSDMMQRLWYLPRSKKGNNPQICGFFFKARLQLQTWIELNRTNIFKQIYYAVRYGSVEVLQLIYAYSDLLQVSILTFEISRLLTACCNLLSYDPSLDVQWPQRRYIQLSKN